MNYIFVPNAVVLILLGFYTWRQNPGRLSRLYFMTNVTLAIWALCFLVLHEFPHALPVNPVSQLQLVSALLFTNGFFYTSAVYPRPDHAPGRLMNLINGTLFLGFVSLIVFSDFVSRAILEEGAIVFKDGPGYLWLALYLVALVVMTLANLIFSYRRYPLERIRIAYMLTGIALFLITAIIFDLVLVLFGNYDLLVIGHISSVFPSLFFAYAITKHDLMDIKMVVQRNTAKAIVAALVITSLVLAFELSYSNPLVSLLLLCMLGVFWAFTAGTLEVFLVTTARRKFVRNWYDAEDILNRLVGKLELEKNRRDIFCKLIQELDNTFELERAHCIVAVRGDNDRLQAYELLASDGRKVLSQLQADDAFLEACRGKREPTELRDFGGAIQQRFAALGHTKANKCLMVPFFSPELLEGVLILGERSNQDPFSRKDRQFLIRLVSYVSAILYRLTPFEKLEKLYFENQRRLHEAEIQLVRAEKTRAIAHATRQAHHEIRTPLNIIRLSTRRIKDLESAEKYKEIIEAQIERAMEIVEETLAITDAAADDQDRFQSVDVNQLLARCIRLTPESVHEKVMELQEPPPSVAGIPGEIQVLFSNLIKNALEAMPDNGVLTVRSSVEAGQVVVTISDTGAGIAPELREKVWEPYFSGKVTGAGNFSARRGWGLTICNRIVTEHKGSIQFVSSLGEGTTFAVRLPAASVADKLEPTGGH